MDSESSHPRSPKRRRVSTLKSRQAHRAPSRAQRAPPLARSSSPDELAGSSDEYTYSATKRHSLTNKSARAYTGAHSGHGGTFTGPSRSHSESLEDSPDELDHTAHTFYRGRARGGAGRGRDGESEQEEFGEDFPGRPPSANDQRGGQRVEEDTDMGYAVEEDEDDHDMRGMAHDTEGAVEGYEDEEDEEEMLIRRMEREAKLEERRKKRCKRYRERLVLKGHRRGVASVKFSPDGKLIASCSADATIRIWDAQTGKQLHVLEGHLAGISTISWGPDSQTLASGSDDKSIWLWNATTGKPYPTQFLGHHNYIYSIAFSPKGNMIVSGSYDEAVFLWDVRGARVMRSLPAHSDPVGGVDFVRDGTLIVSCAGDGLVRIWDTATGQCLRTLVHEDNAPVSSVRFSPNGKYVLAWTLDSCVRLWNYVEGRCIKTYQGHTNKKYSIGGAFGTYGDGNQSFAASGSEDGSVVLWDVTSKKVLQRLEAHEGVVLGLDTKEGAMVTCGIDGTVRVWEVDEGDLGSEAEEEEEDRKVKVEEGSKMVTDEESG